MIDDRTRELALSARRKRRRNLDPSPAEAAALRAYQADAKRAHDQRKKSR